MTAPTLVTIGTDGVTNWVRTPDGAEHNLGPVSPLNFVRKLGRDPRAVKKALDDFLRDSQAMLSVDEDLMWEVLAPRRSRWASDPFMPTDQRTRPCGRKGLMPTLNDDLTALENHIQALDRAAAAGAPAAKMAEGHQILAKLAQKIKSPNQSQNATYYGLGAPDVYEVPGDASPQPHTVQAGDVDGLAFDTYQANHDLALDIINKAEFVNARIDEVADRPGFNAARARADVHAVTSKVARILENVDLTTPWVQADLQKLAARATELHRLFAPRGS